MIGSLSRSSVAVAETMITIHPNASNMPMKAGAGPTARAIRPQATASPKPATLVSSAP